MADNLSNVVYALEGCSASLQLVSWACHMNLLSMFGKRRKWTQVEAKKIDDAVVDFIFNDMCPFAVVDGDGFTNLVKWLNPDYAVSVWWNTTYCMFRRCVLSDEEIASLSHFA